MSGEIGAAGDLATGMVFARAVEPRAGESGGGHAHAHGLCLNCGTALRGDFCHACGQVGHVHRTLASIGHDLLHGVFHFEGKVWRTLPMLVTHPGALTRRYVAGERARFVSPLALFLFSVFLMFAVLHSRGDSEVEMGPAERLTRIARIESGISERRAERERLRTLPAARRPDGRIVGLTRRISTDQAKLDALRSGGAPVAFDLGDMKSTGWPALDKGVAKANANPGLAAYKLQSSAYKYSWALIPISVPLVALLFLWRRGFKAYDHAIFVTYSLSFMTLLVVATNIARMLGAPSNTTSFALAVVAPVHMFFQLRGAYRLRKRSALWRAAVLLVFAITALLCFVVALLVMGLME